MQNQETHASGLLTKLGLFTALMVVISSVIGSGVFKKLAPMAVDLQSGWLILLAWLIAGLITLIGALTNAEVAGLIAEPGGQYVYFKHMYGRRFAYIFGWSCFAVIQSASIASISYVFAESINTLTPLFKLSPEWDQWKFLWIFKPFESIGVKMATIATIMFLTTINYLGVIFGGMVGNVVTVLKIAGISVVIFMGLFLSGGQISHVSSTTLPSPHYSGSLGLFGAMFSAMLGAFWAYDGWNNIGFLGGEVKNPKRNIPIALAGGVGLVIVVYLLINFAYLYVMPVEEAITTTYGKPAAEVIQLTQQGKDVQTNSIVAVEVMRKFTGKGGVLFLSILILICTFGAANGSILSSPRIYFAMARDGLFFKSAGNCHAKFKTPAIALIYQGIWASVLVLSGSFDQLTDMMIFASFIFYGAAALGVFVLRRKMKDQPRPYKVFGYPILPAIFILFCITLVVVTIIQKPRDAGIGLGLIFLGIPFYLFWNREAQK